MLSYLADYAEYERVIRGHRKSGVDKYVFNLKQFHKWLLEDKRDTNPDGITVKDIEDFMLALVFKHNNLKNTTRAAKLSAIVSFFDYMISIGLLVMNPAKELPSPKVVKGLPTKFTTKELALMFMAVSASPGDTWEIRNHALLKVMYASGMRVSELCGLSLEDLNDTGRHIRLQVTGKGGKPRVLTMRANPAAALRSWVVLRLGMPTEHTALFISRRHQDRLKPAAINEVLKKYAGMVGIRDMDAFVHKMRATCFADMYDAMMSKCHACGAAMLKEDIYTLAAFAGHSDPKTMVDYVNISNTVQKRGIPDRRFTQIEDMSTRLREARDGQ